MTVRFSDALAYASALHRGQRRKGGGPPYIGHLLGVASLVMEAGGTEDECIAALLHDAVEDQGGAPTFAAIRRRFGPRVAGIVGSCTEKRGPGISWQSRKEASIRKVSTLDAAALLVLAADKLHNVRSLTDDYRQVGEALWARFRGGREGTLWYYRAMSDALAAAGGGPLVGELERSVRTLEDLAAAGPGS